MKELYFTATAMGLGLAAAILYLVRRDHLYLRDGFFWIGVAGTAIALGVWPGLLDTMGRLVGVAYSPALLFLVAIMVLVIRALIADIALTQLRRDFRRLNQRIAILEADIERACRKRADE